MATFHPSPNDALASGLPKLETSSTESALVGRFVWTLQQCVNEVPFPPINREIHAVVEHFPPGAETWPNDIKPQVRIPSRVWAHDRRGRVNADGTSDAQFQGHARQILDVRGQFTSDGFSDADFFGRSDITPPQPTSDGGWLPRRKQKRSDKVIVHATSDAMLPALESELEARVIPRAVMRGGIHAFLPPLASTSSVRAITTAAANSLLPTVDARLSAAARNRATAVNMPGPVTGATRARGLIRAAVQADVPASGAITATSRTSARSDVTLPAADIRTAATAHQLPPTDTDAELLLLLAALDEDEDG